MNAHRKNGLKLNTEKTFIIDDSLIGIRLDKFLAIQMPEFSRSEIQKFEITKTNSSKPLKLSDKVKFGEEYTVIIPPITNTELPIKQPELKKIELDILFEDEDIIVINKPRGMVMYPAPGNRTDTLVQHVLNYCELSTLGGGSRPGVVHRIDKDTSGAVILAKTDAAYRVLIQTFAEHDLTRKYIAFIWGVPNWAGADIEGNIGRSTKNRQKMTMLKVGGKPAKTHAELIRAWAKVGISQIRCTLFTGRTHQIRVHLSSHGFPVLCDPLYGRSSSRLGTVKDKPLLNFLRNHDGQMLHAEILELNHPITGAEIKVRAPFPDDFRELMEILEESCKVELI